MLEPANRHHLLESLRPPPGYQFDCAVATTYSLDLLAALTTPLAFTLFDWEDREGRPVYDPMALLEAVRRYADRLSIFCQAGGIAPPRRSHPLFAQLENSIFEVAATDERGVFHPKLWILRFTSSKEHEPVRYRLLCLSRNMTFDRSWDTVLSLEGDVLDRKKNIGANRPLADFIKELPLLSLRPLPEKASAQINLIQDELRRAAFEMPDGFDSYTFHPLGIRGYREWPFKYRMDRLLIVSPFISKGILVRLSGLAATSILVSRPEELASLDAECLERFDRKCYLASEAEPVEEDLNDKEPDDDKAMASGINIGAQLSGLHAKFYVADRGWYASVWTGSANATNAAFNRNVEFMVELAGKKSQCGINSFLTSAYGVTSFGGLLQEFTSPELLKPDSLLEELRHSLEDAQRRLAKAGFAAYVISNEEGGTFDLELGMNQDLQPVTLSEIEAWCWPITLHESMSLQVDKGANRSTKFRQMSFEALTSFFAFELTATRHNRSQLLRFVLNIPLIDAPANRCERLMHGLLQSKDQFVRFLIFLLAEGGADVRNILLGSQTRVSGKAGSTEAHSSGFPLFESLVRALDRNPAKLDHIARVVEDFRKSEEGRSLLPNGFDSIWEPIWAARERQKR